MLRMVLRRGEQSFTYTGDVIECVEDGFEARGERFFTYTNDVLDGVEEGFEV